MYEGIYITSLAAISGANRVDSARVAELVTEKRLSGGEFTGKGIERLTGIESRFHCGEGENLITLLDATARLALARINTPISRASGIFVAESRTLSYLLPNTGSIVADMLGIEQMFPGSAGTGCAGGVIALEAACNKLMVEARRGRWQTHLVLSGDQVTQMIKPGGFDLTLFSDVGSALVVTSEEPPRGAPHFEVRRIEATQFPALSKALMRKAGEPLSHDGNAVARFLKERVLPSIKEMAGMERLPQGSLFVPHQANKRILSSWLTDPFLSATNTYLETARVAGNGSAASVFQALCDAYDDGLVTDGQDVYLAAFGEGLSVTFVHLRYSGRAMRLPEISEARTELAREAARRRYASSQWA